ncbi:hypothetical protein RD792_007280 [Penstemon davidsonii]|uniref:TCP domain-containing protein n=1 Tax=Penstemon davidsonii TaxID=160366 RepID=A0ABR0D608_9LAMI|nr:hypothetical protein RD792_007277 [Penstemon davidsonii]KAK4484689.1 hypothetical protein RD792_007280 [Penstemon davidsonii]
MGDSSHQQQNQSRLGGVGLRNNSGGEIVEVQGGHIVRSTGRKDRHSKVCTAKGTRDRRVRLAAHTAIQFYDVQDRLGYDRPSKAVDWLIKKAKSSIDELAQLPAWTPTTSSATSNSTFQRTHQQHKHEEEEEQNQQQQLGSIGMNQDLVIGSNAQDSSFLPPTLDSDSIADTIKSFFPMGASAEANSSAMQFQSFQTPPDLMSRSSNHSQDLRLSLHSFQDPIFQSQNQNPTHHNDQSHSHVLLTGTPLGFDGTAGGGWQQEQHHHQQQQRFAGWNSGGDSASGSVPTPGYFFNSPPMAPQPLLQQLLSHNHNHNQFFTQRGPLQSSNTPSVRAWMDPTSAGDHSQIQHQDHHHPSVMPIFPSHISGIGFSSGYGGFSGFHIPARIQGDEEEHDGYSDKPSSASSDSRH